MALYDRQYASAQTGELNSEVRSQSSLSTFIKQTYQLFAASLLAASAGAYMGLGIIHILLANKILFFGLVIVEFGLIFAIRAVAKKPGINLVVLFAFTFISGLTLAPLIGMVAGSVGAGAVANAFILTTVAFGGLSVFAMNTKKDFTAMGKMLIISAIVLIVAMLINLFTQSTTFQLIISGIGSILFSAFILYDTQNIIRGNYETPMEGAVALYLDFVNLFSMLLQIFGILGNDE